MPIKDTISRASNRGTGQLKLMKKKLIRPLEIVLDVFGKEDILVRNKLLVEVEITECFFMKGL